MCLSNVRESYEPPCPMITDGWKELGSDTAKPMVGFEVNGKSVLPLDKWITATNEHAKRGIKASDGNMYEPGFHVYADEPVGFKKGIGGPRRVFVRSITARGNDGGRETIIAREMYIPSDPNGWPPKGDEPVTPQTPPPEDNGGKKKGRYPVKKFIDDTLDNLKAKGVTPGQA